jgi:phosphatidylglycerophosphate synthase
MLVAKQVADLITWSRGILAFALAGLGFLAGSEALPLAACVMILDWCGDMADGPIARRSRVYYHSWIGDHDLQVDMTVAVGLLLYLLAAGYISWWVGAIYLIVCALYFLRCGVSRAPGMLFQAPIYCWFIWVILRDLPGMGALIILLILAVVILTWPKFPREVIPGFLKGMRKAFTLSSHGQNHRHPRG